MIMRERPRDSKLNGHPTVAVVEVRQNGFCATIETETRRWDFVEGSMTLRRRSDYVHRWLAQMQYLINAEKTQREAADRPKVDF